MTTSTTKLKPVKLMTYEKDGEITEEVVNNFMQKHQEELKRYDYLGKMYKGIMDISSQKAKDNWKPDNRLTNNFAKYIVDTFVGYFNGIPIKKTHDDEKVRKALQLFDNLNDMEDEESELAKIACIYGRAYELMYQNENTESEVIYCSPMNMFMVYDDSIKQKPLFAVYYGIDDNNNLYGTVYTLLETITLTGGVGAVKFGERTYNIYSDLPVVEYNFNEERMGIFEPVYSLINAYNKVLSEKANDVEYFSDQYIAFLGAMLDEENIKNIRDNRIINFFSDDPEKNVEVKFLDKPDSDAQTENLLDRLERLVFHLTMVANISDENFGSSSGISLAYKLQAMSNLALAFQRKFQSALNRRYALWSSLRTNTSDSNAWAGIEYTFTRNEPKDIKEQAETATLLMGITSEETALSVLSVVPDVKTEIERINKEKTDNPVFDIDKKVTEANDEQN